MLEDLSAHVLDIAENSVMANGTEIVIEILENKSKDTLVFSIKDNGKGMSEDFILKVTDPFTTTRTTRRVGMGLPFLKQSAELCDGGLNISSTPGKGTKTTATFRMSSIDRPPLGDVPATMMTLLMGSPEIHWIYRHKTDFGEFILDTDEIIEALDGDREMLRSADVGLWLRGHIKDNLDEIKWEGAPSTLA
ncbi:MAG: sensor histidine kinase [Synergistaceae bacterium]|nr:sensor histidine kinase [Synergistaceae bacterium]